MLQLVKIKGHNKLSLRKITLTAILSAFSLIAFMLESLLPPLLLPGAKIGFANIFVLLAVILLGHGYGGIVLLIKVVLGSLFSGNISAMLYSLPAGICYFVIELVLFIFIDKISIVAISVVGAIVNTSVQTLIFCYISNTPAFFVYLPYLALLAVLSGFIVGFIVHLVIKHLPERAILKKE